MKIRISSTEAARNLGDCLARIKHTGDTYVLLKNRRPVAELVPVAGSRGSTLRELWTAMAEVRADNDFGSDLEKVNNADTVMENPWR